MKRFTVKSMIVAAMLLGTSGVFASINTAPIFAEGATAVNVNVNQTNYVNWEKGVDSDIVAVGVGLPPKNATGAQGKVLARRAAVVDAQRNLVETINGVQVDADTTVENLMVASDIVKTKVSGVLKGAQVIDEKYNDDGSYQVTMRVPIYGANASLATAIEEEARANAPEPAPAPLLPSVQAAVSAAQKEAAAIIAAAKEEAANIIAGARRQAESIIAEAQEKANPGSTMVKPAGKITVLSKSEIQTLDSNTYTGVIVDASSMGLESTFSPVIYDVEGRAVYGMKNINPEFAISKGMVEYSRDLNQSKVSSRAGSNPLVIKATKVGGGKNSVNKVNVVVSVADGDKILLADKKSNILNQCAVVFVK